MARLTLSALVVLAGGAVMGDVINVPADHPTIQAAIDAAMDGDEVVVAAGAYMETIDLLGKSIAVRSADGPAVTTIDGQGAGPVVVAASGEGPATLLAGFTITGGMSAGAGGGVRCAGSSPSIVNCVITGNTADLGGGLANQDAGPVLVNCDFTANTAMTAGGGVYNGGIAGSSPSLTNCRLFDNTAALGGAIYNQLSSPSIASTTISGNLATTLGGGLFNDTSMPALVNTIVWGNTVDQIFNASSNPAVSYSNIQGGSPGLGNINEDPRFVDAATGDLRLDRFSPCVDAGNNAALPLDEFDLDGDGDIDEMIPVDLAGDPRTVQDAGVTDSGNAAGAGSVVDMGARERQEESVPAVFMVGPGESIQDAILQAGSGDEVVVAAGTYLEAINFMGRAVALRSADGPGVTTIDATGLDASVVTCTNAEGPDTVLEGFTITGGTGTFDGVRFVGGGMRNLLSNPTVIDCVFAGNSAGAGGGMHNFLSDPVVTGCTFSANTAGAGGGMLNNNSDPVITGCTFADNAAGVGGGLANEFSAPDLVDCAFTGNTAAPGGGGGIFNGTFSNATFARCTFDANHAPQWRGGGMLSIQSTIAVHSCAFTGNTASQGAGLTFNGGTATLVNCAFNANEATEFGGGGIAGVSLASASLVNCTLAGNLAASGSAIDLTASTAALANCIVWSDAIAADAGSSVTATYSDVQGGFPGTGNVDVDPAFADEVAGDLRLVAGSPVIDAANNDAVPTDALDLDGDGDTGERVPTDLAGDPRFVDDPDTVDTGNPPGGAPFADMGAFEFQGVPPCPADLDGDGSVGTSDLLALLAQWGTDPAGPPDLDGDGNVGTSDLLELLSSWGACP